MFSFVNVSALILRRRDMLASQIIIPMSKATKAYTSGIHEKLFCAKSYVELP